MRRREMSESEIEYIEREHDKALAEPENYWIRLLIEASTNKSITLIIGDR